MGHFLKISLYYIAHGFSKKWLKNHPQFLLHFLIHINVLMLCRKFELIPTKNFRVMTIFKNGPFTENYPVLLIAHGFVQKMAQKSPPPPPQFLLHFLIHIDVLMLCRNFEHIPTKTKVILILFTIGLLVVI